MFGDRKTKLVLMALLILLIPTVYYVGGLSYQYMFPNNGTVIDASAGIRVCSDAAATQNLTSIAWGPVRAGRTYPKDTYVKNTGTLNVTIAIVGSNWNPANLQSYLRIQNNYSGVVLHPGDILKITLMMNVTAQPPTATAFTFNLGYLGTEV